MRDSLQAFCRQHSLIQSGDTVFCAVSGGSDSMALLHALCALRGEWGFTLKAVHVNHHLRPAATQDAELVAWWTKVWQVELEIYDVWVNKQRRRGESVETAARRLRYEVFDKLQASDGGNVVVATAHHQRDQAETVLMRLMRGSGVRGLGGMRPRRGRYIRPLLETPHELIQRYGLQHRIPFAQDESNAVQEHTRNRIRHELLPLLRTYNPQVEQALERTARAAREDEALLQALAMRQKDAIGYREVPGLCAWFSPASLLSLPPPLQQRLLRAAVEAVGMEQMQAHLLDGMRELCQSSGGLQLKEDVFFRVGHHAQVYRQIPAIEGLVPLNVGGRTRFGFFSLDAHILPRSQAKARSERVAHLSVPEGVPLNVRARAAGDVMHWPMGHKKLSEAMADKHIPSGLRDHLPVVVAGDEVVWAPGLRPSLRHAALENEKRILQIDCRLEGEW